MYHVAEHMSCRNNNYIPLATGDTIRIFASAAPCPCPIKVTMLGLPLKAGRFSRSQCKPATRSINPKFPWALPFVPVFKNPDCDVGIIAGKRKERTRRGNWWDYVPFTVEMSTTKSQKSSFFVNTKFNLCAYMLEWWSGNSSFLSAVQT